MINMFKGIEKNIMSSAIVAFYLGVYQVRFHNFFLLPPKKHG